MANYIFAYHGGKVPDSPGQGAKYRTKFSTWVRGLGDAVINPGTPLGASRTISSAGASGESGINRLTGFSIVKAKNLEAALDIAKGCPHLEIGTVEVAEVMDISAPV